MYKDRLARGELADPAKADAGHVPRLEDLWERG